MNKAYITIVVTGTTAITIVVTGTTASTLVSELQDANLGDIKVIAQGDIRVTDQALAKDSTDVWLYEAEIFDGRKIYLAEHSESTGGRVLKEDELAVLRQYGICVEFRAAYPAGNPPLYAIHKEAAEADVCRFGFQVSEAGLKTNFKPLAAGNEQRWLRISMPAWFSPKSGKNPS